MQIGFAKTKSQISATNASINAMKADIITINCSLFFKPYVHETAVGSFSQTQNVTIASTNAHVGNVVTFLRGKFGEYERRTAP